MASGYEDQLPSDDPLIADPNDRLREAFAQLMAQNQQQQAVPMDALMAAQMAAQMPRRPGVQKWEVPDGPGAGYAAPMPQRSMNPKDLSFPTAPMGPESPMQNQSPPKSMPRLPDEPPSRQQDPAPFHGKGSYVLPKKPEKKGKH